MDNTMFGGNVPPLPQWTGAPRGIIHVQAMLYASLAASLFSAFLAMLGKQWLNRYASTDMRGTGIERSQDRQRKFSGIIAWYFDHVLESLPLMLQFALLLLGSALSLYLWEIDMTVACVVLGVTAFGVAFYVFVIVAGTASASCPYQTPWARILRHIPRIIRHIYHHFLSLWIMLFQSSDVYVVASPSAWVRDAYSTLARRFSQQAAVLDSQCVSWILQTSLERGIRLLTLKFLATAPTLAEFTPALVSDCFDIFVDCIKVNGHNPAIVRGMEQLAEASAMCFFLTYSHLSVMNRMQNSLGNVRQRYRTIFPRNLDFGALPFSYILSATHEAIHLGVKLPVKWDDYAPTNHEHAVVAHTLAKLSWSSYQWREVPPLCLSFALYHLPQVPLRPPSVIADCLLIIAMALGCIVPNTLTLEERCVHVWRIPTTLLTRFQCETRGNF